MLEPAQARARADYDVQLVTEPKPIPTKILLRRAATCEALLIGATELLDARTIRKLPENVGIVATLSVGVEHIDIETARAVGLVVTHTPDVRTNATADIAVMLALAFCRRSHLAGAGMDVYTREPNINPGWMECDNALLFPYLRSSTVETRTAMEMRALDNLDAYFRGERPRDQVAH